MKKVINLLTVIIIFATVFTSCEKLDIDETNYQEKTKIFTEDVLSKVKVEDGILCFATYEDFYNTVKVLNNMDEDQYLEWIAKKGVNTLYEKLIESINQESIEKDKHNVEEMTEFTRKNIANNYLTSEKDKDGTVILRPACGIEPLACVLNLQKVVIIDNQIEYYDENSVKIVSNKNFDIIEKLPSINSTNSEVKVFTYDDKSNRIDWYHIDNYYGGKNDKYKIYFTIAFRQIKISSTQYRTWYWTSQSSYKKNIWGNYKYHKTMFRINHRYRIRWTPVNSGEMTKSIGLGGGRYGDTYYCMFIEQTNKWANFTHTHEVYYGNIIMNTDNVSFNYTHYYTGRLK